VGGDAGGGSGLDGRWGCRSGHEICWRIRGGRGVERSGCLVVRVGLGDLLLKIGKGDSLMGGSCGD